ncbi:MAG: prepilin peptidase [bacterium]|nr:prepilin peptidase [bacterium]
MVFLIVFGFGLMVGSFLNAFLYRLEVQQGLRSVAPKREKTGLSVFQGRSFCPHCGHQLSWQDLIPLVSFVMLRGRCRYCKGKISLQYPFVEFACGLLFVATFSFVMENLLSVSFPQALYILYLWAVVSALLAVFVYDLKHYLIPDKILYPAISLVLLWQVLLQFQVVENLLSVSFWEALLSGLGATGFFLAIYLLSKGRAMGFGDVKLALFMGLFLGFPNILVALAFAFGAGALVGLVLIALKRKTMRSEVPFGPFLVLGTLVVLFWGETLVNFYMSLVL